MEEFCSLKNRNASSKSYDVAKSSQEDRSPNPKSIGGILPSTLVIPTSGREVDGRPGLEKTASTFVQGAWDLLQLVFQDHAAIELFALGKRSRQSIVYNAKPATR
jgi:hypothetical protein